MLNMMEYPKCLDHFLGKLFNNYSAMFFFHIYATFTLCFPAQVACSVGGSHPSSAAILHQCRGGCCGQKRRENDRH